MSCDDLRKDLERDDSSKQSSKDKDAGEPPDEDAAHGGAGTEAGSGGRTSAAGSSGRAGGSGSGGAAGTSVAAGSSGSSGSSGSGGSSGAGGKPPAAGGGGAGGNTSPTKLGFAANNVPADVALEAAGELTFNTANCTYPPMIDTAKGQIVGCNDERITNKFRVVPITQTNTSLGTLEAGLLVVRRFVIEQGMKVTVIGNRPLIVVALDEAIINGHFLASATGGEARGGGFGKTENGQNGLGPGGGGRPSGTSGAGGAGFCGKGGVGGMVGMNGGRTYGNPENVPLIGGSSGGVFEYVGSAGGGAIQISAGVRVDVGALGVIHVGGGGANYRSNGGGSGGAILLEAPKVRVLGHLAANGGGGASPTSSGLPIGADGSDDDRPALGGQTADFPKGGSGSAGSTIDGQPGEASSEAGGVGAGGGGGAGRIRINVSEGEPDLNGALISPSKDTPCFSIGKL